MRSLCIRIGFVFIAIAALAAPRVSAQTDVALSLYGSFNGSTSGNGIQESPANAAGGIVELRHISNPIMGFEGTYSYNRANNSYEPLSGTNSCPGPTNCPSLAQTVKANAHELTVDWVPSVKVGNLRPFGVLGIGALFDVPAGSQTNTKTSTKAVYVYGAGLDWGLLPHLGLRLQYRGNLYDAPDVSKLYGSTKNFTHSAQPMIGVYFRL